MAALSFDDLIEVDTVSVPFEFEGVPDDLFELGDTLCDPVHTDQAMVVGKCLKTSPFHQSDSGMSEDFDSVVGSPASVGDSVDIGSGNMLDELVDSMEIQPFCNGADKDLEDYFGGRSPDSDSDTVTVNNKLETQTSVSDYSNPSSPECFSLSSRTRRVQPCRRTSVVPKVIGPQSLSTQRSNINIVTEGSKIKTIKVLKVIKTSGSADTTTEVLQALDDRNKKNAVQARINREKKKHYVKCLEDEIQGLQSENGQLKSENERMKVKSESLEEEVEYLRAVLANDSSLSQLLGNIGTVKNVELSSSIGSRKRTADLDHNYVPAKKSKVTAGVCLHVDNNIVSLEFCSKCSNMAKAGAK